MAKSKRGKALKGYHLHNKKRWQAGKVDPCVYFIRQGITPYVKIGITDSPQHRLQHLQTANPYDLAIELLLTPNDGNVKQLEGKLHKHLKPYHVRGEWYAIPEDTLQTALRTLGDLGYDLL